MTPLGQDPWARTHGDGGGDAELSERPLGELLRELLQDAQGLVREEVRFAKAEIREDARRAGKGAGAMGAGGAVLYAALLLAGATLVLVGATFLPAWLAALIVTALYGIAGGATLAYGRTEMKKARPGRAAEQVKEDARWARETMRDVRSSRGGSA